MRSDQTIALLTALSTLKSMPEDIAKLQEPILVKEPEPLGTRTERRQFKKRQKAQRNVRGLRP